MTHHHDHANMEDMSMKMDHGGQDHHHQHQMPAMDTQASPRMAMHDHMMMMFFHGGYNEVILFDTWRISSVGGLIGSMIACFILGIVYEGIKFAREHIMRSSGFHLTKAFGRMRRGERNSAGNQSSQAIEEAIEDDNVVPTSSESEQEGNAIKVVETNMLSCGHFLLTFLYLIQMTLAYFLMLIVMTFNTWLFLATIFGATAGHFIFGWRKSAIVETSDHCH